VTDGTLPQAAAGRTGDRLAAVAGARRALALAAVGAVFLLVGRDAPGRVAAPPAEQPLCGRGVPCRRPGHRAHGQGHERGQAEPRQPGAGAAGRAAPRSNRQHGHAEVDGDHLAGQPASTILASLRLPYAPLPQTAGSR
jgi:hypothetical protein